MKDGRDLSHKSSWPGRGAGPSTSILHGSIIKHILPICYTVVTYCTNIFCLQVVSRPDQEKISCITFVPSSISGRTESNQKPVRAHLHECIRKLRLIWTRLLMSTFCLNGLAPVFFHCCSGVEGQGDMTYRLVFHCELGGTPMQRGGRLFLLVFQKQITSWRP